MNDGDSGCNKEMCEQCSFEYDRAVDVLRVVVDGLVQTTDPQILVEALAETMVGVQIDFELGDDAALDSLADALGEQEAADGDAVVDAGSLFGGGSSSGDGTVN